MAGGAGARGFDISMSRGDIAKLAKDCKLVAPTIRTQMPKRLRAAAKPVVDQAKANAAAISPQIRIGVRVKLAGRNGASVRVIASSPSNPPLAGLLERGNKSGSYGAATFRHPVYGRSDRPWVDQPTQPYLQPAVDQHGNEAVALASRVLDDVVAVIAAHRL